MSEDLIEKVRYEADITDIQSKLRTLANKQDDLANGSERATGRIGKSFSGLSSTLKGVGLAMGGIAVAGLAMVPKLLDQGAELEALGRKAETVFSGGSLAGVQKWASGVAGSFGVTSTQAVAMATGMADLLKPMGFSADAAAMMSVSMGDLSGALSAWTGGQRSAADVADIITKAMLGERDGLKELGISISEADVQARLARDGNDKLTGSALEQAKALATQQLIMEKSTDAQKAWSDGSMDSIKKQNAAKASMKNLSETITRALFPILQKIIPIVQKVAQGFEFFIGGLTGEFTNEGSGILLFLNQLGMWLGEKIPKALKTVKKFFDGVLGGAKRLIKDLAGSFGTSEGTIKKVLAAIAAGLIAVAVAWNAGPGLIVTAIVALVAGFLWAYENVDWFRKGVQIAFTAVKESAKIVIEAFRFVIDKVKALIGWVVERLQPGFAALVKFTNEKVIPALQAIARFITEKVIPVFLTIVATIRDVARWVGEKVAAIVGFVTGIPGKIKATVSTMWNGIKDGIDTARIWVRDKIISLIENVMSLPRRVGNAVKGMWDGVKTAFSAALNWVIKKWNDFKIPAVTVFGVQVSPEINFPNLPTFHKGGITNFGPSGEGLALLRNNEAVIPLDNQADASRVAGRAGIGGVTINGGLHVHSTESPRRWYDESLWRVA